VNIETDDNNCNFVLTGDIHAVLDNKRLRFSLKRLDYKREQDSILIPFKPENKIRTLQDLQDILIKFGYSENLSVATKKGLESFIREQDNFKEFSEKARDIRNNKFEDKPELVHEFNEFQKVLKEKLRRPLYPLQLLSAYHMAFAQNSCNFAVPGAGKTSIVYGAFAYLNSLPEADPKHVDKLLVIGPLSSFSPWENEYKENFGIEPEVQRLSGDNTIKRSDKQQHLYSGSPAELTLIFTGGVDGLQKEIIDFLKRNKTMIVVDEAHRIKNPEGIWGKSSIEVAKEAVSRVILTGTPAPNGYEDLYNLYQFLYPFKYKEILGFHFENLVDMSKTNSHESTRVKRFIDNISPYFIRIKKSDLKLPDTKDHVVFCEMGKDQREIYDFIETKYIKAFENDSSGSVKNVLNKARLIRLRQAATNPGLLEKPIKETLAEDDYELRSIKGLRIPDEFQDDSEILSKIYSYSKSEMPQKFIEVKKILNENVLPSSGKAIIWTIFIQNAKELQKYLQASGIESKLLIGEVEQPERESIISQFNNPNNSEFQVIIANPFSVAESISLHKGCHNAIYMERDYNCSNFLQSKDRIHRVGLLPDQQTNYYYILSKDSIDDVIDAKLKEKVKRMEMIIDEDIPLFARIDDSNETDLIKALIEDYVKRT
jgi:SNF2 family DNA or RNA helicase